MLGFLALQLYSAKIRVACLGDSITAGYGRITPYPANLQNMLGTRYTVGNFGVIAATLMFDTNKPYIYESAFQSAMRFQPDIVIIMLGTNDAQTQNYQSIDRFKGDYETLINQTLKLENHPKIFLVKPPPLFSNNLSLSNTNLVEGIIPRIAQVASEYNFTTIDCYTPLSDHSEFFVDGVHPTQEGSAAIANIIYQAVTSASLAD